MQGHLDGVVGLTQTDVPGSIDLELSRSSRVMLPTYTSRII